MRVIRFTTVSSLDDFMMSLKEGQYIDLKVSLTAYEEIYILIYKEE